MQKLVLDVSAKGTGKVILDGKDISEIVNGINVRVRAGKLTTVFISFIADAEIKAEVTKVDL